VMQTHEGQTLRPVKALKALTGRRRPSAWFQSFSGRSLSPDSGKRKSTLPQFVLVFRSGDHVPGPGALFWLFSPAGATATRSVETRTADLSPWYLRPHRAGNRRSRIQAAACQTPFRAADFKRCRCRVAFRLSVGATLAKLLPI
jgi:hypothetical protein